MKTPNAQEQIQSIISHPKVIEILGKGWKADTNNFSFALCLTTAGSEVVVRPVSVVNEEARVVVIHTSHRSENNADAAINFAERAVQAAQLARIAAVNLGIEQ